MYIKRGYLLEELSIKALSPICFFLNQKNANAAQYRNNKVISGCFIKLEGLTKRNHDQKPHFCCCKINNL